MLDNTLTVAVDEENLASTTDHVYSRYDEYRDRSIYKSAAHTLSVRDQLGFYRSQPKQNGNFKGTAKSSFKITQDMTVPGVDSSTTLTVPMICEVSFSVPVGVSAADQMIARQIAIALLDDDTLMGKFMEGLEV